jgi:two-component system cell cycle response regulator
VVGTDYDPDAVRLASVERQFWIDRDVALEAAESRLEELGEAECGATARRLKVLIAAVRIHRTDPSQSAVDVQQILGWAEQHGEIALQSRCHDVLGSLFEMVGDRALALEHAVAANDLLADSEIPLMRAAARKCLADALGSAGSLDGGAEAVRRRPAARHR